MKTAHLWILVSLLAAQSIAASLNTLPGEDLSNQQWEGPLFETGARSNHTGSSSGQLNVDHVNTSYNAGDTVHALFNTTNLTSGAQYNLLFILYDSSQNAVSGYGLNHTWNASSSNLGTSASMVNLTNGSYCIVAILSVYDSNSSTFVLLDNATVCFGVGTYSQTTGCGYQATYQTIHVYTASSIDHGDIMSGQISTFCDLVDASLYVSLSVTNNTGTTVASSSLLWTGTGNGTNDVWNVSNLGIGSYTLTASLLYRTGSSGPYTSGGSASANFTVLPSGTVSISGLNSNYSAGSVIQATIIESHLDSGITYGEHWFVTNSNGHALSGYGGNQTWNATSNNNSFAITLSNLSNGTYCITATLYTAHSNGMLTVLDTSTMCFTIGTVSTPSSGCGYESNYTSVYAYAWFGIFSVGDTFQSTINSYCNVYGSTTMIEWTVTYASNSTIVASQHQSWVVNATTASWGVSHPGFEEGNYNFLAKLSVWDNMSQGWNYITDNNYNFSYVNNTSNLSSGTLDIDTNGYSYEMGDTLLASFESTDLVIGERYMLNWNLYDQNQSVVDGTNITWFAYTNSSIEYQNYTIDGAPIDYGQYCFYANLYHLDNNYNATWLTQDDTCIVVSSPGGNHSGNNSGGGGNNTGGNNSEGGGNNSGNSTGCGYNVSYTMVYAMITSDYPSEGDDLNVTVYMDCLVSGMEAFLYWEVVYFTPNGVSSLVDAGNETWSIGNPAEQVNLNWSSLNVGTYNLTIDFYVVDVNSTHIDHLSYTINITALDSDGDGHADSTDNCPNTANPTQNDMDQDGMGDSCDHDMDGDGFNNSADAFPMDTTEWADSDQDNIGDNSDNCASTFNPNQADTNNNGVGDACDSSGNNGNNTTINTPPVISGVTISPNMPQSDDSLTCMYTTFDAEGDSVTTTVAWNVNGNTIASGTDTISTGYAVGDEVQCVVSGSDGQAPGNTDSDTVTILPTVSDVEDGAGNGLPALGSVGTLLAIAIGVGLARRQDD